ncbi:hypothetical protein XELAEV_18047572mg [Xenopus laevis]|uniref:Uncharacterized protein n=1 Tax=Xenopus laevis TaxID=8355 RepID=A0A974BV06_XENLA|nr:hypothetical protein XELAEV_18047572mg [Xenopus laevis]
MDADADPKSFIYLWLKINFLCAILAADWNPPPEHLAFILQETSTDGIGTVHLAHCCSAAASCSGTFNHLSALDCHSLQD